MPLLVELSLGRRSLVALGAFAVLLVFAVPVAAGSGPTNVLLARNRTETSVAVDPLHPSVIVVGSNTNYDAPVSGNLPTGFYASQNGGKSFSQGNVPLLSPYATGADPTVAVAASGTIFFSYLGETPAYCSSGHSAVLLSRSFDHGRSFGTPVLIDANAADDKPSMAVESEPRAPAHLFVVWTRWHNVGSDIWLSRSLDGGRSFSRPIMLYSSKLDNFGPTPVVGPGHRLYVFWSEFPESNLSAAPPTRILLRRSFDDGAHFESVQVPVHTFASIPRMTQPGSLRNLTMPAAGVANNGTIYLGWSRVTRNKGGGVVNADIDLARSTNGGRTWTGPVRVNDSGGGDRFMPALSVLANNSVGIAFYDRRRSSWQLDVYAARVTYGSKTQISRNIRVTKALSPIGDIVYYAPGSTCFSPGRFFGDYIGAAACGRLDLCIAWTDTQLRVYQETDIWFARVRLSAP